MLWTVTHLGLVEVISSHNTHYAVTYLPLRCIPWKGLTYKRPRFKWPVHSGSPSQMLQRTLVTTWPTVGHWTWHSVTTYIITGMLKVYIHTMDITHESWHLRDIISYINKNHYTLFAHVIRTLFFFSILAAEKSRCVKYADFFFFVEVLICVLF
jgi:hypothetical protein